MSLEIGDIDASMDTRVRDSFNTATSNSATIAVEAENVGNTDGSVNDSGNATVDVDGSFNEDSHDWDVDTDVEIEGSGNDNSDDSTDDHSDNSTEDSYNDNSDNSVEDSYNTSTDGWMDDHSINAGVRTYNTGFGDVSLAGAAGGGGDVWVNGQATIVDQSVNTNITAWDDVGVGSSSTAVVASGEGAIAAGDDVDIDQERDESTTIVGGGDVNVGNTTDISNVVHSYNTETDSSMESDGSIDVDIEDSFNDGSESYSATNSFNEELTAIHESDWDVDADVIWNSEDSVVAESIDIELPE